MTHSDDLIAQARAHAMTAARLLVKAASEVNNNERSRLLTLANVEAGRADKAESLGAREQALEAGLTEYGRGPRR
jgi:hypothetical protein